MVWSRSRRPVVVALVAALVSVIATSSSAASPKLIGTVGPSYMISLTKFAKDFTTVSFKGTKTFTLKLAKGKYKYYCSAHESTMFGHFKVS